PDRRAGHVEPGGDRCGDSLRRSRDGHARTRALRAAPDRSDRPATRTAAPRRRVRPGARARAGSPHRGAAAARLIDACRGRRLYFASYESRNGGALRALIFDPFAGISGDMILGALVDLGL